MACGKVDSKTKAMVMHELRSPLHGIIGLSTTLAQAAARRVLGYTYLSLSIYIYMYVCIYIYIYIYRERDRDIDR